MNLLFPCLVLFVLLFGLIKRVPLYDALVTGAKEGLKTAFQILPPMLVMLVAVRLFTAGGGMEALRRVLAAPLQALGLPQEVIPLFLVKPLTGSGALAMLRETLETYGADSRAGLIASTLMGSSETVFYTCAVYLSAAKTKKTRHIIPCALLAWLAGALVSGLFYR